MQLDDILILFIVLQLFVIAFLYFESMFLVSKKNNDFIKGSVTKNRVRGGSTPY